MSRQGKKIRNSSFHELPFDCWMNIVLFYDDYHDLLSTSLTVKGLYDRLKIGDFDFSNIEFYFLQESSLDVNHKYLFVQNLNIPKFSKIHVDSDIESLLSQFSKLKKVSVGFEFTSGEFFTSIGFHSFLKKLILHVEENNKYDFSSVDHLESLHLKSHPNWIDDSELPSSSGRVEIKNPPSFLKELCVEYVVIVFAEAPFHPNFVDMCRSLERLSLRSCVYPVFCGSFFSSLRFPSLKHVSLLERPRFDSSYIILNSIFSSGFVFGSLPSLETFVESPVLSYGFNPYDWETFFISTSLRVLEIESVLRESEISIIQRNAKSLQKLKCTTDCVSISSLSSLEHLDVDPFPNNERRTLEIKNCEKLEYLRIRSKFMDLVLSELFLEELPRLRQIRICRVCLSRISIKKYSSMDSFRTLHIEECKKSDFFGSHLEKLKIKELFLENCYSELLSDGLQSTIDGQKSPCFSNLEVLKVSSRFGWLTGKKEHPRGGKYVIEELKNLQNLKIVCLEFLSDFTPPVKNLDGAIQGISQFVRGELKRIDGRNNIFDDEEEKDYVTEHFTTTDINLFFETYRKWNEQE